MLIVTSSWDPLYDRRLRLKAHMRSRFFARGVESDREKNSYGINLLLIMACFGVLR